MNNGVFNLPYLGIAESKCDAAHWKEELFIPLPW